GLCAARLEQEPEMARDTFPARRRRTRGRRLRSDLGLNEAVVTAFAGAVQEKYHGPFPVLVPIARHINLVAVSFIAELDGSVEKACFVRAGARSQSEEDGAEQNR